MVKTYSPPECIRISRQSIQVSIARKSSLRGIAPKILETADFNSSSLSQLTPFNQTLRRPKKQLSLGAMPGEYGG
ncbi:MAG: hypothetical protein EZS28_018146 [Streblomastix strix]|uniref:Uncharacterized protein n=1 Tax=Streblomastix strix TaxID=222440 RepID=A0A5J4VUL9_9EUKA|nr:MAG: hypothetical protein EZS28_018146 [Streblomastix strix]